MSKLLSLKRWSRREYDWPLVISVMAMLGIWEGLRPVPEGGDSVVMWVALMAAILIIFVSALGIPHTVAFLPFGIAVQDALSTFAQGIAPAQQTWYVVILPDWLDWLAWTGAGFPIWWGVAFVLTVAMDRVADAHTKP